jgi:hypothetical protein
MGVLFDILLILLGERGSLTLLVTTQIEGGEAVVADGKLLRSRVCGRLKDGDTVILVIPVPVSNPIHTASIQSPVLNPRSFHSSASSEDSSSRYQYRKKNSTSNQLTFNMCSSVVLPALSRPRKRSLACLFNRPSEARTS